MTNKEESDVKYKHSKFPDGQQDITILTERFYLHGKHIVIKSRFNSFLDLELIVAATKALRRMKVEKISLYIPYLLGARSDRKFVEGGTSYLVDVIAPILNAQNYDRVAVFDVHSDVASACINNIDVIENYDLVDFAIKSIMGDTKTINDILLVSPDGGSLKKIYKVAERIGYTNEVVVCSKFRDTDGKLTKTHVPIPVHLADKDLVIIDDICDGGRTFINIAEAAQHSRSLSSVVNPERYGKIHLIVSHGIFSAGFNTLSQYFDDIFTTNSVKDLDGGEWVNHLDKNVFYEVKQLNLF